MYGVLMSVFDMSFRGDPKALEDPKLLKALCQKEVERFEDYVRKNDGWFTDGLVTIERYAIAGYLYQKAKGHFDASTGDDDLPTEGNDGS